jgi:hypothetical protein
MLDCGQENLVDVQIGRLLLNCFNGRQRTKVLYYRSEGAPSDIPLAVCLPQRPVSLIFQKSGIRKPMFVFTCRDAVEKLVSQRCSVVASTYFASTPSKLRLLCGNNSRFVSCRSLDTALIFRCGSRIGREPFRFIAFAVGRGITDRQRQK